MGSVGGEQVQGLQHDGQQGLQLISSVDTAARPSEARTLLERRMSRWARKRSKSLSLKVAVPFPLRAKSVSPKVAAPLERRPQLSSLECNSSSHTREKSLSPRVAVPFGKRGVYHWC